MKKEKTEYTLEKINWDESWWCEGCECYIPGRMMFGLHRWIYDGVMGGHFLQSVLENDLRNAVHYADGENIKNLPAYIWFLYNVAPSECWGSEDRVNTWEQHDGLKGLNDDVRHNVVERNT